MHQHKPIDYYQSAFENNVFGIIILNHSLQIIDVNQAFCLMIDKPKEQILSSRPRDYVGSNSKLELMELGQQLIKGNLKAFTIEQKLLKKNTPFNALVGVKGEYDEKSNFKGAIVSIQDITYQEQASQAIQKSEERFRILFENNLMPISVINDKFEFTETNSAFRKMVGYNSRELLGMNIYDVSFKEEEIAQSKELTSQIQNQKIDQFTLEKKYKHKNGSIVYAHITVKGLYDTNNKYTGSIAAIKDITEDKKKQATINSMLEELSKKNEELEKYIESNMQLENFAYIASHNLQSSMRTIISHSQVLQTKHKELLSEDGQASLDFMINGTKTLNDIIHDLLNYSKVNTKKIKLKNVDLNQLLNNLIENLQSDIERTKASIILSNIPKSINIDPIKIRQLFQNLIDNSLKFKKTNTPPKITINAIKNEDHYKFTVTDNGIGIEEEYGEKIFLLFKRLHTADKYQGTGIGLSICKKIVEQHKGKIGFSSTFGQGTSFYFTIPIQQD